MTMGTMGNSPLFRGGQGRSDQDVPVTATGMLTVLVFAASATLMAYLISLAVSALGGGS